MGYYKDTGSLQSMASAEAILKKRMPEKVGILPVAELLFVAESMWVGEHDMKGHFHPGGSGKNRNPDYPNMETDIQKPLLTSPPFDGVWNGAAQDGRREKGKKRMGAFPGASRPVPRLQEGCPCCVQERNVFFRSRCLRPVCKAQRSGDHRASI